VFSFALVTLKVNLELPENVKNTTIHQRFRRIDFLGCLTLSSTVGCLILAICLKMTEELRWTHPVVCSLLIAAVISGSLFVIVEKYWAPYPVMPLRLMTQRTPLAVSLCNFFGSASTFSMVRFSFTATQRNQPDELPSQLYNVPLASSRRRLCSWTCTHNHSLSIYPQSGWKAPQIPVCDQLVSAMLTQGLTPNFQVCICYRTL
jgi:hypothetical protein